MLQMTCMPLINYLPADIICDSFDLFVVQRNRENQTQWRACGAQKGFSIRCTTHGRYSNTASAGTSRKRCPCPLFKTTRTIPGDLAQSQYGSF